MNRPEDAQWRRVVALPPSQFHHVTNTDIRRAVLLHAIVSFIFNTTILALALNLAMTLLG